MQVCTSSQTTTPTSHHSVFTGRMPFLPPNQQRQSTEGKCSSQYLAPQSVKRPTGFSCVVRTWSEVCCLWFTCSVLQKVLQTSLVKERLYHSSRLISCEPKWTKLVCSFRLKSCAAALVMFRWDEMKWVMWTILNAPKFTDMSQNSLFHSTVSSRINFLLHRACSMRVHSEGNYIYYIYWCPSNRQIY